MLGLFNILSFDCPLAKIESWLGSISFEDATSSASEAGHDTRSVLLLLHASMRTPFGILGSDHIHALSFKDSQVRRNATHSSLCGKLTVDLANRKTGESGHGNSRYGY